MKLIETIKNDLLTARKDNNTLIKTTLSTLLGEIQLVDSRTSCDIGEDVVIKVIKKYAKSINQLVKYGDLNAKNEIVIIEKYLPQVMTIDEIQCNIISSHFYQDIIDTDKPMRYMSDIIGMLKESGEEINGGDVSKVIKEIKNNND